MGIEERDLTLVFSSASSGPARDAAL